MERGAWQTIVHGVGSNVNRQNKKVSYHGLRRRRHGELLPNRYRVWFWEDEKVLETDSGNDYTTMWLTSMNCRLKNN